MKPLQLNAAEVETLRECAEHMATMTRDRGHILIFRQLRKIGVLMEATLPKRGRATLSEHEAQGALILVDSIARAMRNVPREERDAARQRPGVHLIEGEELPQFVRDLVRLHRRLRALMPAVPLMDEPPGYAGPGPSILDMDID